jgi:hypothetical protein
LVVRGIVKEVVLAVVLMIVWVVALPIVGVFVKQGVPSVVLIHVEP